MHEGHLTKTLVEAIKKEMAAMSASRLIGVTLKVGEASGIEPESIRFYLADFLKEPSMEGAEVRFEGAEGKGVELVSIEAE